jgi:hypothetical protein
MSKSKKIAVIIALLVVLNIGLAFLSQYFFLNSNIYKSVFSLAEVKMNEDKIVRLSGNPEVYITDEGITAEEFFDRLGLEEIEDKRLGAKRFALKGSDEYSVLVYSEKIYTVWVVEEL